MGRRVDAARQTRDDDMAGLAELLRQAARDALAAGRGDAGADDADAGARQQGGVAARPQQGRRRINGGQQVGIVGVAQQDQPRADALAGGQFGLDALDRGRA